MLEKVIDMDKSILSLNSKTSIGYDNSNFFAYPGDVGAYISSTTNIAWASNGGQQLLSSGNFYWEIIEYY